VPREIPLAKNWTLAMVPSASLALAVKETTGAGEVPIWTIALLTGVTMLTVGAPGLTALPVTDTGALVWRLPKVSVATAVSE